MRFNRNLITATLAVAALMSLAACGDEYVDGGSGDPATTEAADPAATVPADAPASAPSVDPLAVWPQVDGQLLPIGVTEGDEWAGQLRNLGVDETPWGENPVQVVLDRAHQEPLFASELAQSFGRDAAGQVAFHGLNGLWIDGSWTDAGNGFLTVLDTEILEQYLGLGSLPESNKYQVVFANAEMDAVRLTLAGSELVNVGEVMVFDTECGMVAVDVKGNLYVPCDCARIPVKRTPPPPPPPTNPPSTNPPPDSTTPPPPPPPPPPTTTGGKDAGDRPAQDPVVTCPAGQHADRDTGDCVSDVPTGTLPDQGDPSNGDSGPGAPGPGVSIPTTDPAPDPTVPTNTVEGDGPIADPDV